MAAIIPALLARAAEGSSEARRRVVELVRTSPKEAGKFLLDISSLLRSTRAPVRAASLEMLTALSRVSPGAMAFLLPTLHELLSNEPQNAVASHVLEILVNYARSSKEAAQRALPILKSSVNTLPPKIARTISQAILELSGSK